MRLSSLVQSRREFARIIGFSDVTVMGWEGGSEPYDRNIREVAERTGVSFEWLKDGLGDDEEELNKARDHFQSRAAGIRVYSMSDLPAITDEERDEQKQFIDRALAVTGLTVDQLADRIEYKSLRKARSGEFQLPESKRRHIEDVVRLAELERNSGTVAGSSTEKLQRAMLAAGLNARSLAKKCGVQIGVVQAVLGGTGQASERLIDCFVRHVPGITKEELMSGSEHPRVMSESGMEATYGTRPPVIEGLDDARYVPFLSWAQAGALSADHGDADTIYQRDRMGVLAVGIKDRQAFAIEIKGDSMDPEIKERDRVVVCPNESVRAGDTVIVRTMDGDVMCKVYQPKGAKDVIFVSINHQKHPPIEIPRENIAWMYPVRQVLRQY